MPAAPMNALLYNFQQPATRDTVRQCLPASFSTSSATMLDEMRALCAGGAVYDLALLYIHGPWEQWLECCHALGQLPRPQCGPIVLLGRHPGEDVLEKAFLAGVTDWINWPIDEFQLRSKISVLVQLRSYQVDMEALVQQRTRQVEQTRDITIEAISSLVEAKDATSGRHIVRTREYLRVLVEEMRRRGVYAAQLDEKSAGLIIRSAPLHDIGKIGVPDAILDAPRKHETHETEIMERHPVIGGQALKAAAAKATGGDGTDDFLQIAQEIVFYHHEKWDGTGYPKGLVGEAIPLSARLMTFADTYDAARFKRQYKPAKPHVDVVAEIVRDTGKQFDPAITPAFLAVATQFEEIAQQFADDA